MDTPGIVPFLLKRYAAQFFPAGEGSSMSSLNRSKRNIKNKTAREIK